MDDSLRKRKEAVERELHQFEGPDDFVDDVRALIAALEAAEKDNATLRGAMQQDDARLLAATERVGAIPMGCDTADWFADEVLSLRKRLEAAERRPDVEAMWNKHLPHPEYRTMRQIADDSEQECHPALAAFLRDLAASIEGRRG